MSPTEIGGAIVLVLGAITGLLAASGQFSAERRKARSERAVENAGGAAVLLESWQKLGDSISAEVERVKKSCAEDIARLKEEHEEDRKEWQAEKVAMQEEWRKEKEAMQEQIEVLQAQVLALIEQAKRAALPRTPNKEK